MRFARPELLHLLWLIPALAIFYIIVFKRKKRALETFGNLELLRKMTASTSSKRQYIKVLLIVMGVGFIGLALARPQYGQRLRLMKRAGIDIIIALDTSLSMLAEDIKPNRLERAKHEVCSLIDRLQGDRVGLVAFAGDAFVQCPLTLDYGAAKMFLDIVDTDLIPEPGTAVGRAIQVATGAFEQRERKYKVMILLTDGEDHVSDPVEAAKEANQEGVRIYTIGIGSREGAPIPLRDDTGHLKEYKKDRRGKMVMSELDEVTLEKIALLTDGKYYRVTMGEMELDKIYEDVSQLEKKELKSQEYSHYEDRYQYFLLIALVLLSVETVVPDRRRRKEGWRGRFE